MGVRGFDFEDRGGGSEPTSPDRRERAGNTNNCRGQHPRTRCLVPTSSASHRSQPLGPEPGRHSERLTAGKRPRARRDTSLGLGSLHPAGERRRPETRHRLRSEKPRQGLGRRGFDSRHLQECSRLREHCWRCATIPVRTALEDGRTQRATVDVVRLVDRPPTCLVSRRDVDHDLHCAVLPVAGGAEGFGGFLEGEAVSDEGVGDLWARREHRSDVLHLSLAWVPAISH
jgi:hypothetical protein